MRNVISQLRYTIRQFCKSPAFTILGFGIGANAAIFSLINTAEAASLFASGTPGKSFTAIPELLGRCF